MVNAITTNTAIESPANPVASSRTASAASTAFADVLSAQTRAPGQFRNGQLGIEMHADGKRIQQVVYYDTAGQVLTKSAFYPQDILRNCDQFGIALNDLRGLGQQLDTAGIGYRPYAQYAGTDSNHGIDFDNLIAGGLGSAYDWTVDPMVQLKGPFAAAQLAQDQQMAQKLGVKHVRSGEAFTATTETSRQDATPQPVGISLSAAKSTPPANTPANLAATYSGVLQAMNQFLEQFTALSPAAGPAPTALTNQPVTAATVTVSLPASDTNQTDITKLSSSNSWTNPLQQLRASIDQLLLTAQTDKRSAGH